MFANDIVSVDTQPKALLASVYVYGSDTVILILVVLVSPVENEAVEPLLPTNVSVLLSILFTFFYHLFYIFYLFYNII